MKLWIVIFLLLFFVNISHAQEFFGGFTDFGSSHANSIFTDTDLFGGPGILGASDITAQLAFQTIDTSGVTLITACQITDEFCFTFQKDLLLLYVKGNPQHSCF